MARSRWYPLIISTYSNYELYVVLKGRNSGLRGVAFVEDDTN